MRDWVMLGFLAFVVPASLGNTLIAYLLWGWSAVFAPNTWLFGFMQPIPYNQLFALITLGRLAIGKELKQHGYKVTWIVVLFVLFGLQGLLSATFAYPDIPRNWELATNLLKALLFCLVMPLILTNRFRIHAMLIFLILGLSFHGILDALKFIASGGGHRVLGNPKLGDNNHVAVAIAMAVPLIVYVAAYSSRKWAQIGFMLCALLVITAVIATHSRGGFVSLATMAVWMAITGRRKVRSLMIIGILSWSVIAFAPSSWTARMDTIQTAEEDSSFMGRVIAWRTSSAIALENPVLGGGFRAVQAPQVWAEFSNSPGMLGFVTLQAPETPKAAHSIYFEVLGDLGFLGLFLFLSILVRPLINYLYIRALCKRCGADFQWADDLSRAIVTAMVGYLVGGALISAAYFEVVYMLVMVSEITRFMVAKRAAGA